MQLDTLQKKTAFLVTSAVLAVGSLVSVSRSAIAEKYATADDPSFLRRAAAMEPYNAARHHWVGRVALFVEGDPSTAVRELEEATRLNPWIVDYWLDLALAYKGVGDAAAEGRALDKAFGAEPKNLNAAVSEGNFYLSRGDTAAAMQRFRLVLENDPPNPVSVIDTCWRATHSAPAVLAALPARADLHFRLLELLVRYNEPDAAAQVWQHIVAMHQSLDSGNPVAYVDWLIQQKQPAQARSAWDEIQAADQGKQGGNSSNGSLVNAGFEDDIRNAGFDWRFNNTGAVVLFQDDDNPHSGHRSLAVTYNGASTTDAGIWQIFPATPGTTMRLSAYARTKDLLAAIPPRLGVEDYYSRTLVATGPEIAATNNWQPTSVDFTVPAESHLLAVRIVQGPQPTRVKGTVWLDDLALSVLPSASAP
ncbi:MAG: carbohydrate binding domain-containing protein [Terriglobales bacterium]